MNYAIWGLFGPATWTGWLAVTAFLLLLLGYRRAAAWPVGLAVMWFLLSSLSPLGLWLVRPLEARFPATVVTRAPANIVVLGGAEKLIASAASGRLEVNDAGDRVIEGAAVARRYPRARLWIAGGIRAPGTKRTDASWTRDTWLRLGIPAAQIRLIEDSVDTCTNASAYAARRATGSVLLVTSAFHMPRAVACFRASGIEPMVFPVDAQGWPAHAPVGDFSPDLAGNMDRADTALHEWIGLLWYRVDGRIGDLWPAP